MQATAAFNRIGATKPDGLPYGAVRGVSVAATGRHFRFWENDVRLYANDHLEFYRRPDEDSPWRFTPQGRAFYRALFEAKRLNEPVFVTINRHGERAGASVHARDAAPLLDKQGRPASGQVLLADPESGELRVLVDLIGREAFVDQFQLPEAEIIRQERVSAVFPRSQEVRRAALVRAGGQCERCGVKGFHTSSGIYLETHHVIPLSENGRDATDNVLGLCPTCHKEAHFSIERALIREELLALCKAKT